MMQRRPKNAFKTLTPPSSSYYPRTGIFVGVYAFYPPAKEAMDETTLRGSLMSSCSDHVAYFLGTHGPSMTIETACSSSLVALTTAVASLRWVVIRGGGGKGGKGGKGGGGGDRVAFSSSTKCRFPSFHHHYHPYGYYTYNNNNNNNINNNYYYYDYDYYYYYYYYYYYCYYHYYYCCCYYYLLLILLSLLQEE